MQPDHSHHAQHRHQPSNGTEPHGNDKHAGHSPDMFKRKFWLSVVLAIPVLVFSDSIHGWLNYQLAFSGSQYIPAVFGVVLFWYSGLVFLKSAKAEIVDRSPGMMTLISMAITVAFGYSLLITLGLLEGMDFWWELSTLITIMIFGHWMEMASVQNAQGALKELAKLLPDSADLINGDTTKLVSLSQLKTGDLVLVRPGAKVPADGEVIEGDSDVDESMLTGESKPVKKSPKSQVVAGTINGNGSLTIKITKIGDSTALAGIMRLVAQAQASKSKTQILADRAAFYLTLAALGAAFATAISWGVFGDRPASFTIERIVTVLVIACPHALGLAVPLVTAISTTLAAKNGILIRQRIALESARNVDVILFDKTGTLTKGEQGVVDVVSVNKVPILGLAAGVESKSEHPIARAIVAAASQLRLSPAKATQFNALPGRGVKASIGSKTFYVGGPALIAETNSKVPRKIQESARKAAKEGKTAVYVIENKKVLGVIMLTDVIREESREAIETLQKMNKRVAMLTGDSEDVAAWVARELGIDEYFAQVLPEHKADTVKRLQADGSRVIMVGDGVNDAPALTQADIGIAIGAGTDVAIESAGIILASSDPRGVAKVMRLSTATYRKMQQNLLWATGYNALAIPLAAGAAVSIGFVLSPAIGAVLMSISTIIVALNAQLLRKLSFGAQAE